MDMSFEGVKVEVNESSRACRICLAWDVKLYDIHEWGLGDMFTEITGTTLSVWDGFPQHLCVWCRAQLAKAHALRARTRRADALLKQALMHQHFITDSFIRTIDRSLHKLTYALSDKGSDNSALFYCVYDDSHETNHHIRRKKSTDGQRPPMSATMTGLTPASSELLRSLPHETTNCKVECIIENNIKEDETEIDTKEEEEVDMEVFDVGCDVDPFIDDDFPSNVGRDDDSRVDEENKIYIDKFNEKNINTDAIEPEDVEIVATTLGSKHETVKTKTRKRPATQKTERIANVNSKDANKKDTPKERATVKRKRNPQKFCTDEEIKEYEKKHNVELKFLTEEEMVQDMEERKKSDSYIRAPYKCELCYKGCLTSVTFNNHMKSHAAARGEHECALCHWRYQSPGKLRDHMRFVHRIKFHCTICGKVLPGPERAELHAAFHAGAHFKCNYCEKHFRRKTSCWTHMRIAHTHENFDSSCELCGEVFASKKGLKSHKTRSHRETVDKSLFCRRCSQQFDNMEALRHHKEMQGQRCLNNQSACQQCGALCPGQTELIQHKHEAHGAELFTCDACNKTFLSKSSLSVHIDRLHLNIKAKQRKGRYTNIKVKQRKGQYTNYTPMLTDVGEKRRDYVCEECGKAYTLLGLLKQHQMLRHTADKPFKCDQCPRGFIHATQLRTHIDCIHKRLRKWRCPECPKTFLHQSSVNVHRLIHIGKKTHICTYCGKAFLQSGSLITHVKYVHLKITPPPRKRNKKNA